MHYKTEFAWILPNLVPPRLGTCISCSSSPTNGQLVRFSVLARSSQHGASNAYLLKIGVMFQVVLIKMIILWVVVVVVVVVVDP